MQPTVIFKGPSNVSENYSILTILSLFKYELIKLLIFLLLFAVSLVYVNSASHEYYYKEVKNSELIK
jgi:hypothetical protein